MNLPSIFVIVRGTDFLKVNNDVLVFASRDEAGQTLARIDDQAGVTDAVVVEYVPKTLQ